MLWTSVERQAWKNACYHHIKGWTMVCKDGIAYFLTHVRPLCSRGGLNKGVPKGTWEKDLEKICTLNKLKSKRFLASDMRSYRNCKQRLNQQSWYELQGKCIRTCTSDKLIIRMCKVALSDKSVWAFRHHNPLVILISCARTAVYILPYVSTSTIKHQGKRYTKQAPLKHYIKLASNICTKKNEHLTRSQIGM